MQSTRNGPPKHDQHKAASRSQAVEQTSSDGVERCIREEKRGLQIRELLIGDWDIVLDGRDGHRQRLAVEIADGDRYRNEHDEVPAQLHAGARYSAEPVRYRDAHVPTNSNGGERSPAAACQLQALRGHPPHPATREM